MTDRETKLAHRNILTSLLVTTSEQSTRQGLVTDLFLFLLRHSFLLNDVTKPQNSRFQKTPQLNAPQGNIYMGARYLDPKYSRWISVDPALGEYVPQAPVNDDAKKHNQNLPGMGGLFNSVNLCLYHYAGNNPVVYVDPNGEFLFRQFFAGLSQIGSGICEEIGATGISVGTAGTGTGVGVFLGVDGLYNIADGLAKSLLACFDIEYNGIINTFTTEAMIQMGVDPNIAEIIGAGMDLVHDILNIAISPNEGNVNAVLNKVKTFFATNNAINGFNIINDSCSFLNNISGHKTGRGSENGRGGVIDE